MASFSVKSRDYLHIKKNLIHLFKFSFLKKLKKKIEKKVLQSLVFDLLINLHSTLNNFCLNRF